MRIVTARFYSMAYLPPGRLSAPFRVRLQKAKAGRLLSVLPGIAEKVAHACTDPMENDLKKPVFCLASFWELSNVRPFSDRFVWSVAQAMNRREKGETRSKLNKKWNLSLVMRVGDDYSPALVFLRKG